MSDENPFSPIPRQGRTSNILNMRLNPTGFEWLDQQADKYRVSRTEIVKAALSLARTEPEKFSALIAGRK